MSFFSELRRRNVIRIAGAYLALSWLIVQVAQALLPLYGFEPGVVRVLITLLAIGFVPAIALAWVFQRTPGGFAIDRGEVNAPSTSSRTFDRVVIALLAAALAVLLVDKLVLEGSSTALSDDRSIAV